MRLFVAGSLALYGLLLLTSAPRAQETVFYRCTDASGAVTMQNEKPCAAGMQQEIRRIGTIPTAPPPTRSPAAPSAYVPPPSGQFELVVGPRADKPPSSIPEAERVPPPTLYQCRTWDEDDYISENGEPEPRCAPLQTTDASGDPNGGAGSACDMVRDTCTATTEENLCATWQRRVDEAAFRAKYASTRDDDPRKAEYERLLKIYVDSSCNR